MVIIISQAIALSDVTVIVSLRKHMHQSEAYKITLNATQAQENHLSIVAFFMFQGPTESLMLYADALHCNYRRH